MKSINSVVKNFINEERNFRILFVLCFLFHCVCIIEPVCSALTNLLMIWSILFTGKRFIKIRNLWKIRYNIFLILFLLCGIFTTFLNYSNNFFQNIKLIYLTCICFILLYGMHTSYTKEERTYEFYSLFHFLTIIINIFAIIGILILVCFVHIELSNYTLGLYGNRYTGIYTHPNIAAFISIVGIISNHILYDKKKRNSKNLFFYRIVFLLMIHIHILTIWLSDSNASMVYMIVYLLVYTVFKNIDKFSQNKSRIFLHIFLLTLLVFASFSLRTTVQNCTVTLIENIHTTESENTIEASSSAKPKLEDSVQIGRTKQKDISSGRIDSIKKALLLFEIKPLLGMGKANIIPYGNIYLTEGFLFFDLHNGYLTILLSCGIVGFYIFTLFLIQLFKRMLYILNHRNLIINTDKSIIEILISALLGYCIYAFFERTILFDLTFMVIFFWAMLGYFMSFSLEYEEKNEHIFIFKNELINSLNKVKNFLL